MAISYALDHALMSGSEPDTGDGQDGEDDQHGGRVTSVRFDRFLWVNALEHRAGLFLYQDQLAICAGQKLFEWQFPGQDQLESNCRSVHGCIKIN